MASDKLEFLMEAHNGLSARVVEEAGFKGIWASGLAISAQLGVRDRNEASWSQVLEVLEFMADATDLPILLDGDTGYGDFNIARRLVRKLEQRGVAGVCLEDKLFPKSNSLLDDSKQELASIEEFAGKIRAVKDTQTDPDFCVIARVEALIAGLGMEEALKRADAYAEAGADAILIHSSQKTPAEVLQFKSLWRGTKPVVIVPTKYFATPTDVFREAGFSLVIWANHLLRASVGAMKETARIIAAEESLTGVEHRIEPVAEIFRLQRLEELNEADKAYLPPERPRASAIVLAASRGKELGPLTENLPKAMVDIAGVSLLGRIVAGLRQCGIRDIAVVRGYCKEAVDLQRLQYVDNNAYAETGELASLQLALSALPASLNEPLLVCYGDVLCRKIMLDAILDNPNDFVVAVDPGWRQSANMGRHADFTICSLPCGREAFYTPVKLERVDDKLDEKRICGEWTGFLKIAPGQIEDVKATLQEILSRDKGQTMRMNVLMNALIDKGKAIHVVYSTGQWLDVDSAEDVVNAAKHWNTTT